MLAENVGLPIAKHALRSDIPAGYASKIVGRKKRMVRHSLDQQSKLKVRLRYVGLEDCAVAFPQERLAECAQQIGGKLQAGAAYRALLGGQVPKELWRNSEFLGSPLQQQRLGILVGHLSSDNGS